MAIVRTSTGWPSNVGWVRFQQIVTSKDPDGYAALTVAPFPPSDGSMGFNSRRGCRAMCRLRLVLVTALLAGARGAGAQSSPLGLWAIDGTSTVTACARGHCQNQTAALHDFIAIESDGTFAFALTTTSSCPGAPPLLGRWRTRRRTIRLKGTNVRDWWAAVNRCSTSGIAIHGRRFTGVMDPSAGTLRVVQAASSTVRGIFVTVRIVGRFTIAPADDSAGSAFVAQPDTRIGQPIGHIVRQLIADVGP